MLPPFVPITMKLFGSALLRLSEKTLDWNCTRWMWVIEKRICKILEVESQNASSNACFEELCIFFLSFKWKKKSCSYSILWFNALWMHFIYLFLYLVLLLKVMHLTTWRKNKHIVEISSKDTAECHQYHLSYLYISTTGLFIFHQPPGFCFPWLQV